MLHLELRTIALVALIVLAALVLWSCMRSSGESRDTVNPTPSAGAGSTAQSVAAMQAASTPNKEELAKRLTPLQYQVTQCSDTERPFDNAYWNNHKPGIYVDIVDGTPLFSSLDKFDSGTGWPSFTQPLESSAVKEATDSSHGMKRVEVRSKGADSHLGHLFDDGPGPSGQRYCINSASLRFVPVDQLEKEGLGQYLPLFGKPAPAAKSTATETAILAGGCFWGMEELLRKIPGVIEIEAGYTGGHLDNPHYEDTHDSKSGHAEAVKVVFDPSKLSYEELLGWYFRIHDPTTLNRQGNDVGTQYRSAIFYADARQKEIAERVKAKVDASGKWKRKVVTEIAPAGKWWRAEDYHQDYLQKHPGGYTCHYLRD